MADTLQELINGVSAYKAGSEAATKSVVAALSTQAEITQNISDTHAQDGLDATTIQESKNAADYATQLARVKAANALGTNLKTSTEQITKLAGAADQAYARKEKALSEVARKESIRFLDNPIEHFVAAFTIDDDKAAAAIADTQLKSAQDRLLAINAATQQTVITQNAIAEPLTAASMEASARSAAVAATVAAKEAQVKTLGYNVQGITYALTAKKEELALAFQVKGAQNAEQQMEMARQNFELNIKEFEQRQFEFNERQADKQEQLAIGKSVLDRINIGRYALLGDKAKPIDDLTGKMVLSTLKGKGTLSQELQKYYDAGERTMLAGTVVYGTTAAAAMETMQTIPVQLNSAQGPIKGILSQASVDTSNALKNIDMPGANKNPVFVGMDKKDKGSLAAAYNGRAQQILNEFSKVIRPGDSSNPYQIGSVNQLMENSPTIQGLPVVKKVLAPLMKNGVQLNDPKQILSIVGDAVAKGDITHREAMEVTTIYHVGVSANLAMRNFQGFGLAPSMSYKAEVTTAPLDFHQNEVIDMTKPDAISRALVKLQSAKLREKALKNETSIRPLSTGLSLNTKPYQNMTDEERSRVTAPFLIYDPSK